MYLSIYLFISLYIYLSIYPGLEEAAVGAITVELESRTIPEFDEYMFSLKPNLNTRKSKIDITLFISQYCDSNIVLFSIAPNIFVAFPTFQRNFLFSNRWLNLLMRTTWRFIINDKYTYSYYDFIFDSVRNPWFPHYWQIHAGM